MNFIVALVSIVAVGCGAKKVDCDAVATHVADVSTAKEDPAFKDEIRGKIHNSTNAACSDGTYTSKQGRGASARRRRATMSRDASACR